MKIPDKLKIGGKTYKVEITDKLDSGNIGCTGEICYRDLIIRICPTAPERMEADFIHEMLHGVFDHLGYTEHDEKKIDELANALYIIIQDNPEIFKNYGGKQMKHGKKPTREQRKYLQGLRLNPGNWLVCMDTPDKMVIEYRATGARRIITK